MKETRPEMQIPLIENRKCPLWTKSRSVVARAQGRQGQLTLGWRTSGSWSSVKAVTSWVDTAVITQWVVFLNGYSLRYINYLFINFMIQKSALFINLPGWNLFLIQHWFWLGDSGSAFRSHAYENCSKSPRSMCEKPAISWVFFSGLQTAGFHPRLCLDIL